MRRDIRIGGTGGTLHNSSPDRADVCRRGIKGEKDRPENKGSLLHSRWPFLCWEEPMSTFANASFTIESWDEQILHEGAGQPRMTRVTAVASYQGDIQGEGRVEYLMIYREDGSASFIGLERVSGGIAG